MSTPVPHKPHIPLLGSNGNRDHQTTTRYVDLSAELRSRASGEVIDSSNRTYFIYQSGRVQGPYTVCEMIGRCARNEVHLRSEKVLFCPTSFSGDYKQTKKSKLWYSLEELSQMGGHEQICADLLPFERIHTIIPHPPGPDKTTVKKTFCFSLHDTIRMVHFLLTEVIFLCIALHFIIPLIICTFIYCILCILCCSKKTRELFSPYSLSLFIIHTLFRKTQRKKIHTMRDVLSVEAIRCSSYVSATQTRFVCVFVGFTLTPLLVCVLLCQFHEDVHEWMSWLIAYVTWCVFFIVDYYCINFNLWYKHLTKIIIGLHVANVHKQDLVLVLCALSATLPAAVGGFLAHYYLDERLSLRCSEHTVSSVCIGDQCCYVVSSHDMNLANMIAWFGGVRLLSWIVMKADSTLYDISTQSILH